MAPSRAMGGSLRPGMTMARTASRIRRATLVALFLGGCFHNAQRPPHNAPATALPYPEPNGAVFGIITGEADSPQFVETDSVPNVEGQSYGWIIRVGESSQPVSWTEVLTLPASAAVWGGIDSSSNVSVSGDGSAAITRRETVPQDGLVFNFWAVSPGDPDGEYTMVVTTEAGHEYRFRFSLQKPVARSRDPGALEKE